MSRESWIIAAVAGWMLTLFLVERIIPLRQATRTLFRRLLANLVVSALVLAVAMVTVRPIAAWILNLEGQLGLLHIVEMPVPVRAVLGFLLMDLSFYYWHLANHAVPFLWRFHNVHHIDPDLDVTTAFRFHWGETLISAGFRIVQLSLIGLSPEMFLVYELAFQANTVFHHSNLRLPITIERPLNWVLVTPRMHGIHHSQVRGETNSNYSVVLSWWDRLHRTLVLNVPSRKIVVGVPGYARPIDNSIWNLMKMPFARQRDYWRTPGGEESRRKAEDLEGRTNRMAE